MGLAAFIVTAQAFPRWAEAQVIGGSGAYRDAFRLTSSLGIDETWSDNINLAPSGQERSDFVTTISPSFSASRVGSRLSLTFNYNPQFLYYARGTNGATLRNDLGLVGKATLIENLLTFDALASVAQGNVSPFGTLAANSVNGSTNRAETRTYSFGPTLRSHFGSDLSYSAGYKFTGATADNSAYSANHTSTLFAQFGSGTSFRDTGFGADVSRVDQSYGTGNSIVQETAGTTLTYVLSPTLHLRGRVGYDRNSYPTTDRPDLKGASYSGGFDWQPSHHTQVNAQVGHRYFGPTANISIRETSNKFAFTALYSRDQTTSSSSGLGLVVDPNYALIDQFYINSGSFPDPQLRAQAVRAALQQAGLSTSQFTTSNFLSNQLFLSKTLQASLALLGLRNTVTFSVSSSESQGLSNIDTGFDVFDQSSRFRTTTASAAWSYKLGPRTNANFGITKTHNQALEGTGDSRQRQLTASINRQISKYLSGVVSYRNVVQTAGTSGTGNQGNFGNFYSGNYRENAVFGSLRLTF